MELLEVTANVLREIYRGRDGWAHKGMYGRLLIIGGGKYYTGAPALAALAAMRSGCDIVSVATPENARGIVASYSPDIIVRGFGDDIFTENDYEDVMEYSEHFNAVLIGNGIGNDEETGKFVKKFLERNKRPCVIDGDALKFIKDMKFDVECVLTPHAHEFNEISGMSVKNDINDRTEKVKMFAKGINAVVVLKGRVDVISNGEEVSINETGNPFMTKAGTGDVLSGIIAGLLARGIDAFDAANAACYLCGKAGDYAAKNRKEALLATDVIETLPEIISRIER